MSGMISDRAPVIGARSVQAGAWGESDQRSA